MSNGRLTRRAFVGGLAAASAFPSVGGPKPSEIRAVLLHMGTNMWGVWVPEGESVPRGVEVIPDHIRFNENVWRELTAHCARRGMNTVVIDLGDFMRFPSHPELAIKGSWEPERMRTEVERIRALGLEPVPKLNFATGHDQWLKEYGRMIGTRHWRRVATDLINDVCDVFGPLRYFHLGYDEELHDNMVMWSTPYLLRLRGFDAWKRDAFHTVNAVERRGARAWMWADTWRKSPAWMAQCPKSVLLSAHYYDEKCGGFSLDPKKNWIAYQLREIEDLGKSGLDIVPAGTNWCGKTRREKMGGADDVMPRLMEFCRGAIPPEHLKGFIMTSWEYSVGVGQQNFIKRGIDILADAIAAGC